MSNTNTSRKTNGELIQDLFEPIDATSIDEIKLTHTDELIIALCGPIGSPIHDVAEILSNMLEEKFGYEKCDVIRLSLFIDEHSSKSGIEIPIPDQPRFKKIEAQINVGNGLRSRYGSSILAKLAINKIRFNREEYKISMEHTQYAPRRICHILDSIKNQEELDLLRTVYREMLYVIGVFSPLSQRENHLKDMGLETHEVFKLIDRDSGEESESGQTVRDTFPQCDFFLRVDAGTDTQLETRIDRFLHLILGTKVITPTSNESAMYAAASAAGNSACLSRQVGAAVTSENGELVSTGWNDVPKKGGGLYKYDSSEPTGENDKRCWNWKGGKCFNDEEKGVITDDLINIIKKYIQTKLEKLEEEIKPSQKIEEEVKLFKKIVEEIKSSKELEKEVKSSWKLKNLIEFSRSVHAEMHAILNAGRLHGDKIVNGKIFVTTYPCHSCARHIVAAGISEVYYIEPYRKSLAVKLHSDAVSENESDKERVRILLFDGVAPSRYLDLFKVPRDSRKGKGGKLKKHPLKESSPRLEKSIKAFHQLESIVVKSLAEQKIIEYGVLNEKNEDPRTT